MHGAAPDVPGGNRHPKAGGDAAARREQGRGAAGSRAPGQPYDPDARWATKGEELFWLGYKLHLTETCDDPDQTETPNLITNVHTTPATTPDNSATIPIHQDFAERGLVPAEHYLDSGYPSMPTPAAAHREHGIMMITPLLGNSSRQAKTSNGYSRDDYVIDYDTRTATCPQGQKSATWNETVQDGIEKIHIAFPSAPAGPATPNPSAPAARSVAARSPSTRAKSTNCNKPPVQPKTQDTGGASTNAAPASKAP